MLKLRRCSSRSRTTTRCTAAKLQHSQALLHKVKKQLEQVQTEKESIVSENKGLVALLEEKVAEVTDCAGGGGAFADGTLRPNSSLGFRKPGFRKLVQRFRKRRKHIILRGELTAKIAMGAWRATRTRCVRKRAPGT